MIKILRNGRKMQKNLNKMLQETYLLTCLEVISRVPVGFGCDRSIFNFKRVGEATIFTRFPVITYPGPRGFLAVGFASPLVRLRRPGARENLWDQGCSRRDLKKRS